MKILLSWLREYVPFTAEARQLASDLSMLGLAVDSTANENGETVLELDITTNRPDCLSHYGVAREVAARYDLPLEPLETEAADAARPRGRHKDGIVEIATPELCARYSARILRGVEVKPSPPRVTERLRLTGVRAINNIADATNYLLMALGHPMHAFDLDKLAGGIIIVRLAREGERLTTLDGVERKLSPEDLVIADAERPVALAGVMGGEATEISPATRNVLLESAWFDPRSIRRTAKRHGLHTEASHRFERGADIGMTLIAVNRCAALIRELAGGVAEEPPLDAYPKPVPRPAITLRRYELTRHLGMEIPAEDAERILHRLGFAPRVKGRSGWTCHAPTFRVDVTREIDLVEEVARHFGYDKFPPHLPAGLGQPATEPADLAADRDIQRLLAGLGYDETVSLVLVGRETEAFSPARPAALANPLSEEAALLRTSLLPRLLDAVQWNVNRGQQSVRLFESGKVYAAENGSYTETAALALVATGDRIPPTPAQPGREFNFYDLKGDVQQFVGMYEFREVVYEDRDLPSYYRPGHSARAVVDGTPVAQFGQLDPDKLERWKFRAPVFAAEIFLQQFRDRKRRQPRAEPLSRYPAVERDFSLLLPEGTPFAAVRGALEALAIPDLVSINPVEIFRGTSLPEGFYSLLLRVVFQSAESTLTEKELTERSARIIQSLERDLGARVRAGS